MLSQIPPSVCIAPRIRCSDDVSVDLVFLHQCVCFLVAHDSPTDGTIVFGEGPLHLLCLLLLILYNTFFRPLF